MIIIVSTYIDISTQKVIEYLNFYKKEYIILSKENKIENVDVLIENDKIQIQFTVANKLITLDNVISFWYRREFISFKKQLNEKFYIPVFEHYFNDFKNLEIEKLKKYLSFKLKSKSLINNEEDANINKLIVLDLASQVGLLIPNTSIINAQKENLKKKLIVKPIGETINFYYDIYMCRLLTCEYQPKSFTSNFPTLLQTNINKLFEIRAFFLSNKFFSIAIFSQQNTKSKIDYRNYDFINSNRSVPFNLPKEITKKCKNLMSLLKLNSGSINFIYTTTNEFVFLEVNPIGQFDNVSKVGNYYLEHKIATILANGKY